MNNEAEINNENNNENKSNRLLKIAAGAAVLALLWVLDAKLETKITRIEAEKDRDALLAAQVVDAKKMATKMAEISAAMKAAEERAAKMQLEGDSATKMTAEKITEISAAIKTAEETAALKSAAIEELEGKLHELVSLNREISLERDTLKEEKSQLLTKLRDESDREASLEITLKGANQIARSLYLDKENLQLKLTELAERAKSPLHWARARWGSEQQ